MPKRKILLSRVIPSPTGFLVFNAGTTDEVPDNLVRQFEDEGVIERTKASDAAPKRSPAAKRAGTRASTSVPSAGRGSGQPGTGDAPVE